jgi:hypothetical protein
MVREAGDYFAGGGRLHATLRRLAQRLSSEGIAYALLGGMALGEHGYVRMTEDVDVLLTAEGLARFRDRLEGQGYVGTHPGATRSFRDVESGVRIEVRVLALPRLVELKLASGTSAPHRLRDLADVQEIIKTRGLDDTFAQQLDASVRQAYLELLRAVRTASPERT